jgi:hypothetical protein
LNVKKLLSNLPLKEASMRAYTAGRKQEMPYGIGEEQVGWIRSHAQCLMISSVTFLASPNSIIVLGY